MKKVALVTDNLNRHDDTIALLDSIKKLDVSGLDFLVVVVDKTPNDWLGDRLDISQYPNVELLQAGSNNGFSGGYNLGMRYAVAWGADYVAIINNDTLIGDKKLIKKMIEVLDSHPEVGAVSPKIYFAPGYEYQQGRYKKSDSGKVIWYAGGKFDMNDVRAIHVGIDEVDQGKYDRVKQTGFITGCCLMSRSETLEKNGYFNDNFFAYFEDVEWQYRLKRAGMQLWYRGDTWIYHKTSQTLGIGSKTTDYLLTRNRLYFTRKFAPARTQFAVFREMIRHFISGRPAQRMAIIDFVRGITGPPPFMQTTEGVYKYPKRLSIIVSAFRTAQLTGELLKSIYNPKSGFDPKQDEVLVLNDATDDDLDSVMANYPQARYLKNSVNRGFVAGNNRLMEYSRGELVLMFNTDIEVRPGSLTSLINTSRKLENNAVLGGNLYFPDGTPQDCCFNLPTVTGAIREYLLKKKGSYFMFRPKGKGLTRVEGAVMAVFLIPKKVMNRIGVLNRKLIMYFEDIDYCRRLKQADIPVYFCPDAVFIHHHGAASKKMGKTVINQRIVISAKTYHGPVYYALLTATLWFVQKVSAVMTPTSNWKKE